MPTPQEKLAQSLEALHELQGRGVVAIRSDNLSRTDRERLLESGFLKEVMKGWYISSRPDESAGDSTAWYASFWDFSAALIGASEQFFRRASTDVRSAMAAIRDASDILALLLEGGHSTIAGRIAGAFRSTGQEGIADDIVKTMGKAGYIVRESDPFADAPPAVLQTREPSPYVNRVRLMWQAMREPVLAAF